MPDARLYFAAIGVDARPSQRVGREVGIQRFTSFSRTRERRKNLKAGGLLTPCARFTSILIYLLLLKNTNVAKAGQKN